MHRSISVIAALTSCIGRVPSPAKRSGHARIIPAISSLVAADVARATSTGRW